MLENSTDLDLFKEPLADKYLDLDTLDNHSRAFACTDSSRKICCDYVGTPHDLAIDSINLKNMIYGSKVLSESDNTHYLHPIVEIFSTFWTPLFSQETCRF